MENEIYTPLEESENIEHVDLDDHEHRIEFNNKSFKNEPIDVLWKNEAAYHNLGVVGINKEDFKNIPMPEIEPYTEFNPKEEVKNILKRSHAERKESLESFKQSFNEHKKGIAETIQELHNEINTRPDTSQADLLEIIAQNASKYRLTKEEMILFNYAIEGYEKKHSMVEKHRSIYPNDHELFNACFGFNPNGKVVVTKSPMTLTFHCYDEQDYNRLYSSGRNDGHAEQSGAFAIALGREIEDLAGTLIVENTSAILIDKKIDLEKINNRTGAQIEINSLADDYTIGNWSIIKQVFGSTDRFVSRLVSKNEYEIRITNRNEHGQPTRVELVHLG